MWHAHVEMPHEERNRMHEEIIEDAEDANEYNNTSP